MFLNRTLKKTLLLLILSIFSFSAFSSGDEVIRGKCENTIAGNQSSKEDAPIKDADFTDIPSLAGILNTKIEDYFTFNVRVHKALSEAKIVYVGDLTQKTEGDLLDVPGLGRVLVGIIAEEVAKKEDDGLSLGMELEDGWNQHGGFMAGTRRAATRVGSAVSSGVSATGRGAKVAGGAVAGAARTVTPSVESLRKAASVTGNAVSSGVSATGRGARVAGDAVAGAARTVTPSVESLKKAANAPLVASANVRDRVRTNRQRRQDQAADQKATEAELLSMPINDYLKPRLGLEPVGEGKDSLEELVKMMEALEMKSYLDYQDFVNSRTILMDILPNHVSTVEDLTQKSKADLLEIEGMDERNVYWLEKVLSNDNLSLRTIRFERTRRIGSAAVVGAGSAVRSSAGSVGRGARATGRAMAGAVSAVTPSIDSLRRNRQQQQQAQETESTGEPAPEETVENASESSLGRFMRFFRRSAVEEPEVVKEEESKPEETPPAEEETTTEETPAEDTTPAEESETSSESSSTAGN